MRVALNQNQHVPVSPKIASEGDRQLRGDLRQLRSLLSALAAELEISVGLYGLDTRLDWFEGPVVLPFVVPDQDHLDDGCLLLKGVGEPTTIEFRDLLSEDTQSPVATVAVALTGNDHPSANLSVLCSLACAFISMSLKITKQAQQLHDLRKEQDILRDQVNEGLLILDRAGHVKFINSKGKKILRIGSDASTGLILKDELGREPVINKLFASRTGYRDRVVRMQLKHFYLSVVDTAVPITDERGEVVSIVNIFRDLNGQDAHLGHVSHGSVYQFSDLLGKSLEFRALIRDCKQAAHSAANIVIRGEKGTGKTMLAHAMHSYGDSRERPFAVVNCALLSEEDLGIVLFGAQHLGHDTKRKGIEGVLDLARGGTLVLDNVAQMPLSIQARLCEALSAVKINAMVKKELPLEAARIIAICRSPLEPLVASGRFLYELFREIGGVTIDVPRLVERRGDIEHLAAFFAGSIHPPSEVKCIKKRVFKLLAAYEWPGNVAQLSSFIVHLVSETEGAPSVEQTSRWLEEERHRLTGTERSIDVDHQSLSIGDAERRAILVALQESNFNLSKAARTLGIARPTLYAKMKKYQIHSTST